MSFAEVKKLLGVEESFPAPKRCSAEEDGFFKHCRLCMRSRRL